MQLRQFSTKSVKGSCYRMSPLLTISARDRLRQMPCVTPIRLASAYLAFAETSSICSSPFIEIVLISLASRSMAFMSTIRMRLLSKVRK